MVTIAGPSVRSIDRNLAHGQAVQHITVIDGEIKRGNKGVVLMSFTPHCRGVPAHRSAFVRWVDGEVYPAYYWELAEA